MADMSLISVIIPAYNQANYLGEAVDSVLKQTYQEFEIIIVDDGSSDNTLEVVSRFFDKRIRYIYQENRGLSGARNTGILNSKGIYLSFLDSDDKFLPENLALLLTSIKRQPEISWVAGQAIPINENGVQIASSSSSSALGMENQILLGNPFPVGTMMIHRNYIDKVGYFDETLRAYEDWDLWLRFAKAGCKFASIDHPVFLYRYHQMQMTREGERMRTATFKVLDKVFSNPDDLPHTWKALKEQAYANAHLRSAAHYYYAKEYKAAANEMDGAIHLNPKLKIDQATILASQFSAWAGDPRNADPIEFLENIYDHLPETLSELAYKKRQNVGQAAIEVAFEAYRFGDYAKTHHAALRAFTYQPRWLLNRGALVIFLKSWLKEIQKSIYSTFVKKKNEEFHFQINDK